MKEKPGLLADVKEGGIRLIQKQRRSKSLSKFKASGNIKMLVLKCYSNEYICLQCNRDKRSPKLFCVDNDTDPGPVPPCLEETIQIEEMLIAR